MVAVSMDDAETMKKFKESLKAEYPMISDPQGKVVNAYDVKVPALSFAQRFTFVIGQDRKVISVQSGGDAIDPAGSIKACPLHPHADEVKPDAKKDKDGGR